MFTKIAGAVPTWTSWQVLESEVRAAKNAGECPYAVDGCCPHLGTGRSGAFSTRLENDGYLFRVQIENAFELTGRAIR